jgi:7,8-dihydropterin-6-yl-methyl-4-(beta-D-ribofuranosyl)aminobenzene 5'-phosphate synthase
MIAPPHRGHLHATRGDPGGRQYPPQQTGPQQTGPQQTGSVYRRHMCTGGDSRQAMAASPRPSHGEAVGPLALRPVDEIRVTTLVDNVYDGLLPGDDDVTRTGIGYQVAAPQFESGGTTVGLRAEHGFSALVEVRQGDRRSTVLYDTGLSPDAMVDNADRMQVSFEAVQATVLSHGHFDHAGGLAGLAERRGRAGMPLIVHPNVWTRRRLCLPAADDLELPTLSRAALQAEGFEVIEHRGPSLWLDACVLVTGEIDRTTEFEHGMPTAHQGWDGTTWRHDPLVVDDQALVVNVRGRGLVVVTGCSHAGVVNIVRHAMRLTGVNQLAGLIGGFHLGGPAFEPIIAPTVAALEQWAPTLVIPGHCTGWRAQHALAARLPDAWRASSSGSTYTVQAAPTVHRAI